MPDNGYDRALLSEAREHLDAYKDRLMTRRGSAGMDHEQRLLALTELIARIDRRLKVGGGDT